jgi:hypothetical protein
MKNHIIIFFLWRKWEGRRGSGREGESSVKNDSINFENER